MGFGMVFRMDPEMRQVVEFGDWSRGRGIFWRGANVNMGHPVVTSGEFAALWPLPKSLCDFDF